MSFYKCAIFPKKQIMFSRYLHRFLCQLCRLIAKELNTGFIAMESHPQLICPLKNQFATRKVIAGRDSRAVIAHLVLPGLIGYMETLAISAHDSNGFASGSVQ